MIMQERNLIFPLTILRSKRDNIKGGESRPDTYLEAWVMILSKTVKGTEYIGTWGDKKKPVYDILDINGLNQIVGYVKHKYASEGTVLFRGQCRIHPHIIPSIKHDADKLETNQLLLNKAIDRIYKDVSFENFFDFDQMVKGWEIYIKTTFEAILQHYGAKTFSVDFVDNLWVALWFGLYSYNSNQKKYQRRKNTEAAENGVKNIEYYPLPNKRIDDFLRKYGDVRVDEISKENIEKGKQFVEELLASREISIIEEDNDNKSLSEEKGTEKEVGQERKNISENNKFENKEETEKLRKKYSTLENEKEIALKRYQERNEEPQLFLFLYLAETEVPEVQGLYLGKKTYAVDLRRAIPSWFLRPVAQHGWIVKGREDKYSFDDDIVCVLRLSVKMVDELLGYGNLLSQENFFPAPTADEGYLYLLQHQEDSGFEKKGIEPIFPRDMITCYKY